MATSSSSAREIDLQREVRRHEVALDELNNLPSSRAVYQKSSNLFFRTTVEKLKTSEQKQLDTAKAELQKHNR